MRNVAEILQRQRPDVVLLNELDHDPDGVALQRFQDGFLSQGQNGAASIHYPYAIAVASNTGVPSGHDLNNDGVIGTSGRAGSDERVDYELPSRPLRVLDAGVFWPLRDDPLWRLTGEYDRQWTNGFPSSDHRLVWVDVAGVHAPVGLVAG